MSLFLLYFSFTVCSIFVGKLIRSLKITISMALGVFLYIPFFISGLRILYCFDHECNFWVTFGVFIMIFVMTGLGSALLWSS